MRELRLFPDGSIRTAEGAAVVDPLPCLGHAVHLEPGFSLRSFFAMLGRYDVLLRLGDFLGSAAAEVAACPLRDCVTPLLSCLEIQKTLKLIGFPGSPRLEIQTAFHGLAGHDPQEIRFFSFDKLLDMPIRLGKLNHVVLGDTVSILEFDTAYGLFEFIEGVAWELGFHHVPKNCTI